MSIHALLMRVGSMLVLAAGLSVPGAGAEIAPADAIVTVTGESAHSFEEAKEDALRKAVEMGAGKEVFSDTRIADYALMHDTIVSRAAGYVKGFDILEKKEAAGAYSVKIRATVALGKIKDDWGAIQVIVQQEGRPNLLVVCTEEIMHYLTGQPLPGTGNIAESKLRDHFIEKRFDLIDDEALAKKIGREVTRAMLARDEERAVDAANKVNADYLVIVTAKGRARGPEILRGMSVWTVDADLRVKIMAADTALLVADKFVKQLPKRSEDPTSAARDALHLAVNEIWPGLLKDMLTVWDDRLINGRKIECVGRRIPTSVHDAIVRGLEKADGVKSVSTTEHDETLTSTDWVVTRLKPMRLGDLIAIVTGGRANKKGYSRGRLEYEMVPVPPPPGPGAAAPPGGPTVQGQGSGGPAVGPAAAEPVASDAAARQSAGPSGGGSDNASVPRGIIGFLDNPPAWLLPAVISAVAIMGAFIAGFMLARKKAAAPPSS